MGAVVDLPRSHVDDSKVSALIILKSVRPEVSALMILKSVRPEVSALMILKSVRPEVRS